MKSTTDFAIKILESIIGIHFALLSVGRLVDYKCRCRAFVWNAPTMQTLTVVIN